MSSANTKDFELRIITPAQWQTMSWANGGGITHEIVKDAAEPWRYRLSIAEVAQAGPFSHFAGIDRQIMMLEGNGFVLNFADGRAQSIVRVHEPFAFAGEADVQCELVQGAVRDFNVMTRRSAFTARLSVQELTGADVDWPLAPGIHAVLVLQGALTLRAESEIHALDSLHCALIEHADAAPLTVQMQAKTLGALCAATRVALISFTPADVSAAAPRMDKP